MATTSPPSTWCRRPARPTRRRRGTSATAAPTSPISARGQSTNHVTFTVNTISTYNIFEAARQLGIKNVVWASSETVYGIPYPKGPAYVPVDEEIQRPETAYSLSKLVGEEIAKQFCRWDPKLKIVGLRFSNVMEPQD